MNYINKLYFFVGFLICFAGLNAMEISNTPKVSKVFNVRSYVIKTIHNIKYFLETNDDSRLVLVDKEVISQLIVGFLPEELLNTKDTTWFSSKKKLLYSTLNSLRVILNTIIFMEKKYKEKGCFAYDDFINCLLIEMYPEEAIDCEKENSIVTTLARNSIRNSSENLVDFAAATSLYACGEPEFGSNSNTLSSLVDAVDNFDKNEEDDVKNSTSDESKKRSKNISSRKKIEKTKKGWQVLNQSKQSAQKLKVSSLSHQQRKILGARLIEHNTNLRFIKGNQCIFTNCLDRRSIKHLQEKHKTDVAKAMESQAVATSAHLVYLLTATE